MNSCTQRNTSLLRIGVNLWPGYETLYLAKELGYYNDAPIYLVDYPSGTEEVRAYRNNEIEGAALSIDQAIALASTQNNIKIITIMDISHGGDAILGKPNIQKMEDLKGKKVGVESTALGAFFLARALEQSNLSIQDIEIVSLETTEHEMAYEKNEVDAIVTFGKPLMKIKNQGASVLFDSSQIPGEIVDTIVINEEQITKQNQTIQSLIDGRFKALSYLEENPAKAVELMAKRTGVTPQQMLDSLDGLIQPSLIENQNLLDSTDSTLIRGIETLSMIMLEKNLIAKSINAKDILEDQFVENVKE